MMFMDTPEAVKLRYESPELLSMSDAPRYINGEVYIPIEAFLELTGDQLQS
jgi:hypothetical protein